MLHRNLRVGRGELDLICLDPRDQVLVMVEVKTRARVSAYDPAANLDVRKRRALRTAAERVLRRWGWGGGYRLDLICVEAGQVTQHLEGVEW
jgi:Holliday junction resolvase-like predicted endonuclease